MESFVFDGYPLALLIALEDLVVGLIHLKLTLGQAFTMLLDHTATDKRKGHFGSATAQHPSLHKVIQIGLDLRRDGNRQRGRVKGARGNLFGLNQANIIFLTQANPRVNLCCRFFRNANT